MYTCTNITPYKIKQFCSFLTCGRSVKHIADLTLLPDIDKSLLSLFTDLISVLLHPDSLDRARVSPCSAGIGMCQARQLPINGYSSSKNRMRLGLTQDLDVVERSQSDDSCSHLFVSKHEGASENRQESRVD